jgi:proteasome assembly chaperone (PAC2) family protein
MIPQKVKLGLNPSQVKKKLNSPILIPGFPGAGLVGSISTSYIINRLHMNQIACVESQFIVLKESSDILFVCIQTKEAMFACLCVKHQ